MRDKNGVTIEVPDDWKPTAVRRLLEPFFAFVGRGDQHDADTRDGSRVFKIIDEYGVEREVYAPRGIRLRWPDD